MNMNDETVEAVAKAIAKEIAWRTGTGYTPADLANAALAAIPEPATVGGVTREQVAYALAERHSDIDDRGISDESFQEWLEDSDAILALFPPAPSTVGSVDANWPGKYASLDGLIANAKPARDCLPDAPVVYVSRLRALTPSTPTEAENWERDNHE